MTEQPLLLQVEHRAHIVLGRDAQLREILVQKEELL